MQYVRQIRRGPFALLFHLPRKRSFSEKFKQSVQSRSMGLPSALAHKPNPQIKIKNKLNNSIMVKIIVVGGVAGGASAAARLRRLNGTSVICDMCFLGPVGSPLMNAGNKKIFRLIRPCH